MGRKRRKIRICRQVTKKEGNSRRVHPKKKERDRTCLFRGTRFLFYFPQEKKDSSKKYKQQERKSRRGARKGKKCTKRKRTPNLSGKRNDSLFPLKEEVALQLGPKREGNGNRESLKGSCHLKDRSVAGRSGKGRQSLGRGLEKAANKDES